MKRVVSLLLTLLLVISLIPLLPSTTVSAVSKLDNVVATELIMRYDENLPEENYTLGRGEVTSAFVWKSYLLMTVNYYDECPEAEPQDRSQVFVYSLEKNTPEFLGAWNKADLNIPARNGKAYTDEDFFMEIYADEEYIYLATCIGKTYNAGLYVYENCLEAEGFPNPTRVAIEPNNSTYDCVITSDKVDHKHTSGQPRDGFRMTVLNNGDTKTLVTIYGKHGITANSAISMVDITTDASAKRVTRIKEPAFFTYTDKNGIAVNAEKIYDAVFEGNRAYVLVLTDKQGTEEITNKWATYMSNNLAIFTLSFENPHNPIVEAVSEFNGDFPYDITKDINGNNPSGDADGYNKSFQAGLTVDEGYAYVSTSFISLAYMKNQCPHTIILEQNGNTFTRHGEIEITSEMRGSGTGFNQVQVIDGILVGVPADGYTNPAVYIELSDDGTGFTGYRIDSQSTDGTGVYSRRSVKLGTKAIFPCLSPRTTSSDTNRGTAFVIDVIAAGGEWEGDENKIANSYYEGIYGSFDGNYLKRGVNTLKVTGENLSGDSLNVSVVFALYNANGIVEKTQIGEQRTIAQSGKIDITESIDLSEYKDLSGKTLKAYLWNNMTDIIPVAQSVSHQQTAFTFTLPEAAAASAGVYDERDILVRTLWSAVNYEAGTYTKTWDGLDDFGNAVPDGNYTVKVIANNVEYEKFIPVIGNTSDCSTWDTYISSYNTFFDMSFDKINNRIYYCSDHVEGGYGMRYLNADNIHRNGALLTGNGGNNTATHSATDGERVYWGVSEPTIYRSDDTINTFIFATYNDVDENGVETSGKKYKFTEDYSTATSKWWNTSIYSHALNLSVTNDRYYNRIGGVEVQQEGDYLISAFRDIDKVYVNNKISGKDLFEYNIEEPSAMAMSRGGGALDDTVYIAYNTDTKAEKGFAVAKYTINSDGSLTKESNVITGHSVILGMALSPDGSTLALAQGGNEDKVFIYNTADFSLKATYGSGASYYTDPTVYDDKLMFDDLVFDYDEPYEHSFLEFKDNDSIFVGDSGNTRILLLDLSTNNPTIEDMISFQSNTYSTFAVVNDETRIFSEKKEFSVDYAKMEDYYASRTDKYDYEGFRDAWKLSKNYLLYLEQNFPEVTSGICATFFRAFKADNGYTYFGMNTTDKPKLYKQAPDGTISQTGIDLSYRDIHPDGSIWYKEIRLGIARYYQLPFQGFDENHNPVYGAPVLEAEIDMNKNGHIPQNSDNFMAVTDNNRLIVLDSPGPAIKNYDEKHMQLGSINISGDTATEFEWTAAPATTTGNQSDFPKDGYFDLQGPPQYTSKYALAYGENIIFHYRGEGYKSRQANSFLHFHESGLLIGVFGKNLTGRGEDYDKGAVIEAQPCNSMSTSIARVDDDTAYIFQNTEGAAGGVHLTRVTGLTSIYEQNIPVILKNGMINGVAYTCYSSDNLDIMTTVKKGISNNFNIPYITQNTGTDRSVRFEGYYIPRYTDSHRLSIKTDGKVKMVIDDNKIVDGIGDVSVAYYMEDNRMYKFIIEISALEDGTLSYFDMGYMEDNLYKYIESSDMLCFYPAEGITNKVNLLDGFTYMADFDDGMYGWQTGSKGPQHTDNKITVTLNRWNYHYDAVPDIHIELFPNCYRDQNNAMQRSEIYLERKLENAEGENWKIDMDVRYYGNFSRTNVPHLRGGTDSSAIEIVDKNGKIIADLLMYHNGGTDGKDRPEYKYVHVISNNEILFYDPKPVDSGFYNYFSVTRNSDVNIVLPQRFTVEPYGENQVKVSYMGSEAIVDVLESGADVTAPAGIRIVGFNNRSMYRNNSWDITRLDFIKDTTK